MVRRLEPSTRRPVDFTRLRGGSGVVSTKRGEGWIIPARDLGIAMPARGGSAGYRTHGIVGDPR